MLIIKILKKIEILLPDIEEQNKIVSALDSIDNLMNKHKEIIENEQRYKLGLIQKLLLKRE